MTPKDKAKELIDKFKTYSYYDHHDMVTRQESKESHIESTKECALIAVDEVVAFIDEHMQGWLDWDWKSYWEQVKKEIEKI